MATNTENNINNNVIDNNQKENLLAFDYKKYVKIQTEHIKERINLFDNKLYIEFGGKIFDDFHASRVLPGFKPDSKIKMLTEFIDESEFIIAANAKDISSNKIRSDNGLSYENEVLKLIKLFKEYGFKTGSIVISLYTPSSSVDEFIVRLENLGYPVYKHYEIDGYPYNTDFILSDNGFGKNDFVITTKPLVFVTAPGPGSGKLATCLSQLYHEFKNGVKAGYAKFETFPVWNLPLKHPVNQAYEAATADLEDFNMIDFYHTQAHSNEQVFCQAVNYNRDMEAFPVLKKIFEKIYGVSPYSSPTDMGVNMIGYCIVNEALAIESSKQEVIRRYYDALVKVKMGKFKKSAIQKINVIMDELGINILMRKCVEAAELKREKTGKHAFAIQLPDGRIVTGKESKLLTAASACLINSLKILAGIDHKIPLLSPTILNPILEMKKTNFKKTLSSVNLSISEVLLVLAVCSSTNPVAQAACESLKELKRSQGHSTKMLTQDELNNLSALGIQVTTSDLTE